ncbi:DNA methyltransferase [Bacillus sp. Brlt_9]|uniref:DNA methyltransferase n=1 Tax=Bacillus sp. Brlt_9 TaxID=3110916 RepID=UPI003F7C7BFE
MDKDTKQLSLLDENTQADNVPVVCLGMTFENDEIRRRYFQNELRKILPDLKGIEGFPVGEDEDIIALSDPPYYTVCPNPWINDFIEEWEREKVEKHGRDINEEYHREPFAADVSEGKSDPVYMAHAYHTKVPHKAIMKYILHYTEPGDVIFDGFSGTGMAGVAASLCDDRKIINELGMQVDDNKNILNMEGDVVAKLGKRKAILNDLSTVATHISYNYNTNKEFANFEKYFLQMLNEIEEKHKWMLTTSHSEGAEGIINFVAWSEVFICPNCSDEFSYWDVAVDLKENKVKEEFKCEGCGGLLKKKDVQRATQTEFNNKLNLVHSQVKLKPVLINYSVGSKRYEKVPDKEDLLVLEKIKSYKEETFYPVNRMITGDEIGRLKVLNLEYVFQIMSIRNDIILGDIYKEVMSSPYKNIGLFVLSASIPNLTWMYRWRINKKGGSTSGTYYICSTPQENNPFNQIKRKFQDIKKISSISNSSVISTQSSLEMKINDNSVDYIFTDPPFGANLMYSELNFIWESWLRLFSNQKTEAIVNNTQGKNENYYKDLMYSCFKENYRILKPGRWMTVEFSNSKASIWNAIQEAIQKAGFIIANVSALDKKQGSFKAVTTATAVKQDLVISAYKPKQENIEKIKKEINTTESSWTFVNQHLEQLPVFIGVKGEAQIISERTPRILFDRMVAYHVQNGLPVPISSAEFQSGVAQRFPMRDGMAFLESQVAEYDKKRTLVKEFAQMSLFVSDENSAIEWIRQQLLKKPQTRQDLHPNYMKEIQHIAKHELLPELDDLLQQNFLSYEGDGEIPDQVASYLRRNYKDFRGLDTNDSALIEKAMNRWYVPDPNKQADLEKLREKSLLREFSGYVEELESSKKKLKQFRTEAIRAGFKKAYSEKEFDQIVKVGDRLPEKIIQEDDKLLMYYDNACIRLGL